MEKFKDLFEKNDVDMADELISAYDMGKNKKLTQYIDDYIDTNYINSPDYVPDETNDYYFDIMSDKEIKTLYLYANKKGWI